MSINSSEKNTIVVYAAIIIIIFILAGTIFSYQNLEKSISNQDLRTISNAVYEINYSNYWKDVYGDEKGFELKRNDNVFKLVITKLEDSELGKDTAEFSNEALYEIDNFNSYKMKIDEQTEISERKYNCHEKLLENDTESIMLYTIKDYKNLYNFSFRANNKDFDNVLVEVESDLNYFFIQNENVVVYSKEYLTFKDASFTTDEKLDGMIIQNSSFVISENDYEVTFSLPSNFAQDKEKEDFIASFKGLNASDQGSISIKIDVVKNNSIEYLTENAEFDAEKDLLKSEKHTNFVETYSKIDDNTYMYKTSYLFNPWKESKSSTNVEEGSEMRYETCYLVYEINKENSVIVKIESKISGITQKLVSSVKLIEAKKAIE